MKIRPIVFGFLMAALAIIPICVTVISIYSSFSSDASITSIQPSLSKLDIEPSSKNPTDASSSKSHNRLLSSSHLEKAALYSIETSHLTTMLIIPSQSEQTIAIATRLAHEMGDLIFLSMSENISQSFGNLFDRLPLSSEDRLTLTRLLVLKDAYEQENPTNVPSSNAQPGINNPFTQEIEVLLGQHHQTYNDYNSADQERLQIMRLTRYLGESHKLDSDQQWALTSAMYQKRKLSSVFDQMEEFTRSAFAAPPPQLEQQYLEEVQRLTEEYNQLVSLNLTARQQVKMNQSEFEFWPGID